MILDLLSHLTRGEILIRAERLRIAHNAPGIRESVRINYYNQFYAMLTHPKAS